MIFRAIFISRLSEGIAKDAAPATPTGARQTAAASMITACRRLFIDRRQQACSDAQRKAKGPDRGPLFRIAMMRPASSSARALSVRRSHRCHTETLAQTSRLRTPSAFDLDERAPRLDLLAHQRREDLLRRDRILDLHPQQAPHARVHRRFPELRRDSFRPGPCSAAARRSRARRRAASRALP